MKFKLTALFALAAGMAFAIPGPAVTVYGLVRDAYGSPYNDASGAKIRFLDKDDTVLAECNLGSEQFGQSTLNYRVTLEMDYGTVAERANATVVGEELKIQVLAGSTVLGIIPADKATFVVPDFGTPVRLDLATGADADNDGIPDEWEQTMIYYNPYYGQAGQPSTPAEFDPNADYDGDGFSNMREYLSGTNPFDASEVFKITKFEAVAGHPNVMAITFTTSDGRNYRLQVTDELKNPIVWAPAESSATPDGTMGVTVYKGDGYTRRVYVPRGLTEQKGVFYTVAVE